MVHLYLFGRLAGPKNTEAAVRLVPNALPPNEMLWPAEHHKHESDGIEAVSEMNHSWRGSRTASGVRQQQIGRDTTQRHQPQRICNRRTKVGG